MNDFIYCKGCNGDGVHPLYPQIRCPYCNGSGKIFTNLQNSIENTMQEQLERYKPYKRESAINLASKLPEILKSRRNKKLLLLM